MTLNATTILYGALALLGAAIIVRTVAAGGAGMTVGILVGIAFLGIGVARIYIARTRGRR